jgi:hypothetical protein
MGNFDHLFVVVVVVFRITIGITANQSCLHEQKIALTVAKPGCYLVGAPKISRIRTGTSSNETEQQKKRKQI